MKILRNLAALGLIAISVMPAAAQERSTTSGVQRRSATEARNRRGAEATPGVTQRQQDRMATTPTHDADLEWMRVLYRQLDLNKPANSPLYYPEDVIDGQKNLFRTIMELVAQGTVPVYEYLDGREIFTDQYKVKVRDMLDRFHILYTEGKGSTEKRPRFVIDESDVPANEVLSYYVIERWEFDRRTNKLRCNIEAICPVLHRSGDFGGEAVRYPMFWLKYDDLKPYLGATSVFISDDNNMATHTLADYFAMGLYDGEIYKTRNLRNLSMNQLYSDPDARKAAQDSIQRSLDEWGKKLWVPSLEELEAAREARAAAEEAAEAGETAAPAVDVIPTLDADGNPIVTDAEEQPAEKKVNSRVAKKKGASDTKKSTKKSTKKTKVKKAKAPKSTSGSSSAVRSVRNRKR